MFKLEARDLEALCVGAAILGSGGGGHPAVLSDTIRFFMDQYGSVDVMPVSAVEPDDLIIPLAMVGAPLIFMEKVPNVKQFEVILEEIKRLFPEKRLILMPAEIGGCNALTPMLLALKHQLPLLDADLIGRAFPEISMCKPFVMNHVGHATFLASSTGDVMTLKLNQNTLLEGIVRDIACHFGSSIAIATYLCEGRDIAHVVIEGSLSRALALGKQQLNATITQPAGLGRTLQKGRITDVFQKMKHGFLIGHTTLQCLDYCLTIYFQNEYLEIKQADETVAASPDIIVLLDQKTQRPLTTDALVYGLEVEVCILDAPSFWLEQKSRKIVDKKAFSLEML